MELQNKTIVITGSAHGLGKAMACLLIEKGASVALVDQDEEALIPLQSQLQKGDAKASVHVADLADSNQIAALPEAVLANHGQVDMLINNAGVSVAGPLEDQSEEDILWISRINYLAPILMCRAFLPLLRQQPESMIVNVSSGAGFFGIPKRSTYSAAKFGLRGFSQALRVELQGSGVRVLCAYPGAIGTEMSSRARFVDPTARIRDAAYLQRKGKDANWVAARILRAMQKNKAECLVDADVWFLEKMTRFFPRLFERLMTANRHRLPGEE